MSITTNGAVTPPIHLNQHTSVDVVEADSNKRKREADEDGAPVAHINSTTINNSKTVQIQGDILEILQQHDTQPSFLEHALNTNNEPSPKKAKISTASQTKDTIRSKLEAAAYTSLSDLQRDAETASRDLLESIRAGARGREGLSDGRLTLSELKQIQRVRFLKQTIEDVVAQDAQLHSANTHINGNAKGLSTTNGDVGIQKGSADENGSTVLTLFGNGPTPRQLFSSRQHAVSDQKDPALKTELPVEELGLPNGLATTKISASSVSDQKPGPTFEEAFPPPYNLPALQPPKPIRRPTTRDTNITWEFKDAWSKPRPKGGFTVQPLSVGEWLAYGGPDPRDDISSPQEKRKLRDRALSSGETSLPPPTQASREESLAKEEEALFRRAYSSFAPSYDNSKALVPEETKNMVWWHKIGHKRFDELFAIDPALRDEVPSKALGGGVIDDVEKVSDEDFGRIVEEYTDLDDDAVIDGAEASQDKTSVDAVLQEISELLQTLASHQRIRHASLPPTTSASRTSISPAPTLASRTGLPDSPAEDEVATYQALRREIAYLILQLPPYAVAKLDGDQLSDLGVSRLITFESQNIKGSMEEDQVARQARNTAMATAAGIASLTRSQSSSSGQHYSSTNQRAPAIGQAANTRYGGQYGVSRTPLTQQQYQRSGTNQGSYGTPTASAPRTSYSTSNYLSQSVQSRQGYPASSSSSTAQQYYQRPGQTSTGGYAGYPQSYQSTPNNNTQHRHNSNPSTAYSSQPLAQFQKQYAQNVAARSQQQSHAQSQSQYSSQQQQQQMQAAANNSPLNRTMSPVKYTTQNPQPIAQRPSYTPTPTTTTMQQQQQQRQQSANSDRATPTNFPSQPQTPVNGVGVQQRPPSQGPQQAAAVDAGSQTGAGGQQTQANGHV